MELCGHGEGASAAALRQPARVPYGSFALTHRAGAPASPQCSEGLWGGKRACKCCCECSHPGREPLKLPEFSHSSFCRLLTWEMSVAFPAPTRVGPLGKGLCPPLQACPPCPAQHWVTSLETALEGRERARVL